MKALEPLVFEQIQKCIKQMQCQKFKGYLLDKDCHFNSFILFFHSTGSIVLAVLRTLWTLVLSGLFFSFLLTPLSESSLSLSFPDCFHAAFSPVLSVLLSPQPRDITTSLEPRELRHLLSLSRSSFHFSVNLKSLWPDRILST